MKRIKAFRKENYGWFIDLEDIDASVAIDPQTGDILLNEGQGDDCFHGAAILRQSFIGIALEQMSEAEFQVILKFGKERTHSLGATSQKEQAERWVRDVASMMASATPSARPTAADAVIKAASGPYLQRRETTMRIVEVYVGSEGEAMLYREHMKCLGVLGAVVRIVQDPWLQLPAVRTERNLYQGETNVGRVLGALSAQENRS